MKSSFVKAARSGAVIAALALISHSVLADGWNWRPGVRLIPSAALTFNGQTIEDGQRTGYQAVTNARNKLFADLQAELNSRIGPKLTTISGYQWHTVTISGPIALGITPGSPVPGPTVSLGGMSAELKTNFKQSFGPLSAECTVTANTGALNFAGNLDVVNGVLSNLKIVNLTPTYTRDCSSSFSWIPILGQVADDFLNSKVDSLLGSGISQIMARSQETFRPVTFAGLNTAIPTGKFVYGSFDAGQYVTNNLSYLVSQANAQVRFAQPLPATLYSPFPFQAPGPINEFSTKGRQVTQKDEAFSITFATPGNNFRFVVYDNTLFNSVWECKPIKPVCSPANTL